MNEEDKSPSLDNPIVANDMAQNDPVQELEAAKKEIAQLKDQALRALAEAENTRKRAQRDREEAQRYGISSFARDILDVADNLSRALSAISEEALAGDPVLKNLFEGVQATERQLEGAMQKQQIRKVWPLGEKFDSHLHQAMFEVPTEEQPAGQIVQVLQAGYMIHDRLLRPAMVAVAKNGSVSSAPPHIDTKA